MSLDLTHILIEKDIEKLIEELPTLFSFDLDVIENGADGRLSETAFELGYENEIDYYKVKVRQYYDKRIKELNDGCCFMYNADTVNEEAIIFAFESIMAHYTQDGMFFSYDTRIQWECLTDETSNRMSFVIAVDYDY